MPEDSTSSGGVIRQPAPAALSHAEIVRVMAGLMTCVLLGALDQTVVIPAIPTIGRELNAYSQLSWIVAAYLITSTISTPIYGKLSDLYGRRRLLTICIALFIATSILCALARSLNQLVWFRALQGLGGGGLMALTQAAIADVMSPRERGRYQGYLAAVWAVTSVSGPLVGGFVTEALSWRWIFWVNLPIGAAAMWGCHSGLRRLKPPVLASKPKLDVIGMVLLSGALLFLLLALGWGGDVYAWGSVQILSLIGGGFVLLLLLVLQELRTHDPVLPPRLFTSRVYVANTVVSTATSTLLFMCLLTIPLYFQMARGASAAQSGMYLIPFMLTSTVGNVAGSRYGRRHGVMRGEMRLSAFTCCVGLGLLAALPLDTPVWIIVIALIVAGPGIGGCFIGSMMNSQNALAAKDTGSGTGALLVLRSVGGAAGSTVAGAIIATGSIAVRQTGGAPAGATPHLAWAFSIAYAVAALLAGISFAVTLWMPNTKLRDAPHAAQMME